MKMGYPMEIAGRVPGSFMRTEVPRLSMLRRFAKTMGVSVKELVMEKPMRCGWWLLGATMLATGLAIVGIVTRNRTPPPDAFQTAEMVRGMNRSEVAQLLSMPNFGGHFTSRSLGIGMDEFYCVDDDWYLQVHYDERGMVSGTSILYGGRPPPWYLRAWYSLQQWIPWLPNMHF
jgi:hypothetical protein